MTGYEFKIRRELFALVGKMSVQIGSLTYLVSSALSYSTKSCINQVRTGKLEFIITLVALLH